MLHAMTIVACSGILFALLREMQVRSSRELEAVLSDKCNSITDDYSLPLPVVRTP